MAKTTSEQNIIIPKREVPKEGRSLAGRPMEFWKKILEETPAPVRKEDPKPSSASIEILRLPKEQLDTILKNLGSEKVVATETFNNIKSSLKDLNIEDVKEILNAALNSNYSDIRLKAVELIPRLPEKDRIGLIKSALNSEYEDLHRNVFEIIKKLPEDSQFELLSYASYSDNPYVRRKVFWWLVLHPIRAIRYLLKKPRYYSPEFIRSTINSVSELDASLEAIDLAFKLPPSYQKEFWPPASQALKTALNSDYDEIRSKAFELIPQLPGNYRIDIIKYILNSNSNNIRLKAVELIPRLPEKDRIDLINLIKSALNSEYPDNRLAAFKLISTLPKNDRTDLIKFALNSEYPDTRLAAVELISSFSENDRIDLIKSALNSEYPDTRLAAVELIPFLPGDHQLELFKLALMSVHEEVRFRARKLMKNRR